MKTLPVHIAVPLEDILLRALEDRDCALALEREIGRELSSLASIPIPQDAKERGWETVSAEVGD